MRSVTKTPFEISLNINDPESRYAAVVFDAEGNPLSPGSFVGTEGEYAIGERDISTVYVYGSWSMPWNILSGGAIR